MRILVISDIHANIVALEAVIADAGTVDAVWCLGDIVGYGPNPNECVERLQTLPELTAVLGNHDVAALGEINIVAFNGDARRSLEWQIKQLTPANVEYLKGVPREAQVRGDVTLAHGSPRDPVWEYVLNTLTARLNLESFTTPWCFVGHSHIQCLFQHNLEKDRVAMEVPHAGEPCKLIPRAILNPGSVGQPRDRNPRAAYAIYDPQAQTWEPRRVEYDYAETQKRIRAAGLPEKHAARLTEGW
jgi:predicted phosphodiesterase